MGDWDRLLDEASAGSDTALGRLVTALEARDWSAISVLGRRLLTSDRTTPRVGITGAAGVGKSTLLAALGRAWPGTGRVGGIAVDPSSEVSGGAVLGDRYRLYGSGRPAPPTGSSLFFRSMAARGGTNALSPCVGLTVSVMEEAGLCPILLETAGAGQSDTGVKAWVDCLVLVLTPESGDIIQMIKAGLMEHADVYVVNKADRQDAGRFAAQLRGFVASQPGSDGLAVGDRVHLLRADRADAAALTPLIASVQRIAGAGSRPRAELWRDAVSGLLAASVIETFERDVVTTPAWQEWVRRVSAGEADPAQLSGEIRSLVARLTPAPA
jgi:putative protein kinase ArgK-like GTPase of G3E family